MQTQSAKAEPTPFGLGRSTFANTAEAAGHARQSPALVEPTAGRYESLEHGAHADRFRWSA